MEVGAVGILGFTDLNSGLEGGFVYPPEKITCASPNVNPSITTILEVLHFLDNLLMTGNVHLEVVALEFSHVFEGAGLSLSCPARSWVKPGPKNVNWSFLYALLTS